MGRRREVPQPVRTVLALDIYLRRLLVLIACCLVVVGCGGSKRTVVSPAIFTGKFQRVVVEAAKPTSQNILETETQSYAIRFKYPLISLPPFNSTITVRGILEGKTIRQATVVPISVSAPKRGLAVTKKIAWIAFYYTGKAAPWTKSEIEHRTLLDEMSVKNFYEVESFNNLKIEGHVYGPYVVNSTPGCDPNNPPGPGHETKRKGEEEAIAKAKADGYETTETGFTNTQRITPEESGQCGSAGVGMQPGENSWVNLGSMQATAFGGGIAGEGPVQDMSHELGHNFNLEHTRAYTCTMGEAMIAFSFSKIGGECVAGVTGNVYDLMGTHGGYLNFTAAQRQDLGWWETSQVKEVTTSGNYTIKAAQNGGAGVHLLKIKRPSSTYEYYYVEFNEPGPGLFANWNAHPIYTNTMYVGPMVQLKTVFFGFPTYFAVFLEPDSFKCPGGGCISTTAEQNGATLPVGKTYEDTETHMKIKTESSNATETVVKVTFAPTIPAPPAGLSAKSITESQSVLQWTPVPEVTYKVFRVGEGAPELIGETTERHFVDEEAGARPKWRYFITANNAAGESGRSGEIFVNMQPVKTNGALAGWMENKGVPVFNATVKVIATIAGKLHQLSTTTDVKGFYQFTSLEPTQWEVGVYRAGFGITTATQTVNANEATIYSLPELPLLTGKYKGINSHADRSSAISDAEVKHEFTEMLLLGVNNVRVPISWSGIENFAGDQQTIPFCEEEAHKSRGDCRALLRLKLIVNEANAHGILVDGTITDTPPWAAEPSHTYGECEAEEGKLECYTFAPTTGNLAKVRSFTKYITALFGTKLVAVAALNEPQVVANEKTGGLNYRKTDGTAFANPTVGTELATKYVAEANEIYAGAKEGNPLIKVFAGESDNKNHFLENIIVDKVEMDGLGLHAYAEGGKAKGICPEEANTTQCKIEATRKLTGKPIWVNEWGYTNQTSEPNRANFTKEGAELLSGSTFPYVEGFAYYQLRDQGTGSGSEENFGLLTEAFVQKPPFNKFKGGIK